MNEVEERVLARIAAEYDLDRVGAERFMCDTMAGATMLANEHFREIGRAMQLLGTRLANAVLGRVLR